MAKRGEPGVLRQVVIFLRSHANRTQAQFGKECGLGQAQVSRYELGDLAPSEEALRRMARVAGIDWPLVVHLRQFYTWLLAAARHKAAPAVWEPELALEEPVKLALAPYLLELQAAEPDRPSPEEERREAEEI